MSQIKIIYILLKTSIYYKLNPRRFYSNQFTFISNLICYLINSSFIIRILGALRHKSAILDSFFTWNIKFKTIDKQIFYISLYYPNLPKIFPWEAYLNEFVNSNDEDIIELIKSNNNEPKTIIDIGAHIGLFCCRGAYLNSNYNFYCIEPQPENFKALKKNINFINNKNVKFFENAISNISGYEFLIKGNSSTTASLVSSNAFLKNNLRKKFKVKTICLNEFLIQNEITKIDILKVDIEGGEYLAFEQNLEILLKVKYLIFELHMCNNVFPENTKLYKFIKENFITTHHYPSKAHGKKLLEIFGTKKL